MDQAGSRQYPDKPTKVYLFGTCLIDLFCPEAGIDADRIAVALCRVGDRENEIDEARAYVRKAGYGCLKGSLPEKTGYRRASDEGRAVSEVTYPTLKERAEEVAQSVIDRIAELQRQEVA